MSLLRVLNLFSSLSCTQPSDGHFRISHFYRWGSRHIKWFLHYVHFLMYRCNIFSQLSSTYQSLRHTDLGSSFFIKHPEESKQNVSIDKKWVRIERNQINLGSWLTHMYTHTYVHTNYTKHLLSIYVWTHLSTWYDYVRWFFLDQEE